MNHQALSVARGFFSRLLGRLRLDRVDILHLHNPITETGGGAALDVQQVLGDVVPAFERLRAHFSEAQIVELGMFIAFFLGFGRLGAAWDMTEDLPAAYQDKDTKTIAPWATEAVLVRG